MLAYAARPRPRLLQHPFGPETDGHPSVRVDRASCVPCFGTRHAHHLTRSLPLATPTSHLARLNTARNWTQCLTLAQHSAAALGLAQPWGQAQLRGVPVVPSATGASPLVAQGRP